MPEIIVPVGIGPGDAAVPFGPQIDAKYVLTGPDGTRAAFNDQADADYVGMLNDVTGLDSPEVRESADDRVQMDGGLHGDFYYGRRPVTLQGIVLNPTSPAERNQRITRLLRASNAMRADATLSWTLSGGETQFLRVRRQQPVRITGAWQKEFLVPVVAADPRVYGLLLHSETRAYNDATPLVAANDGNATTYPTLTIFGPATDPSIMNLATGEEIVLNYVIPASEFLVIDTLHRRVLLNNTVERYSAVDFAGTTWWGLQPGDNEIDVTYATASAGAALTVEWRSAWI